jgi:hypothetical protein
VLVPFVAGARVRSVWRGALLLYHWLWSAEVVVGLAAGAYAVTRVQLRGRRPI